MTDQHISFYFSQPSLERLGIVIKPPYWYVLSCLSPQNPTNKKELKSNFTIILGYNGKVQLVEEILNAKNIINNPERRAGIEYFNFFAI